MTPTDLPPINGPADIDCTLVPEAPGCTPTVDPCLGDPARPELQQCTGLPPLPPTGTTSDIAVAFAAVWFVWAGIAIATLAKIRRRWSHPTPTPAGRAASPPVAWPTSDPELARACELADAAAYRRAWRRGFICGFILDLAAIAAVLVLL